MNRNTGLQEACADALDCDAVLTSFLNDFLFYCQSNPVLPFSPSDPAAITAEVNAVSSCHNFRNAVSFRLLQSDDVTTFCSTESQGNVDMTDTVDAFKGCCTHVERAKREFSLLARERVSRRVQEVMLSVPRQA